MITTIREMVYESFNEIISEEKAAEFWDYTTYETCTMEDVKEIYYMIM